MCENVYNINMKKKDKKKKLDSIPKINRRLFKLWSLAVREPLNGKCEFCGKSIGEMGPSGKPINKLDAHHLLSRNIKDCPLKFDIRNGVGACPFCHKFGTPSFHRDPITTITWLQEHQSERYNFVLENCAFTVDLQNRKVLEEIESKLKEQLPLDLDKINAIEAEFPRSVKVKVEIEGSLFDEFDEFNDLSSSSSED